MLKLSGRTELLFYDRFMKRRFPEAHEDKLQRFDTFLHQGDLQGFQQLIGVHPEEIGCLADDNVFLRNITCIKISLWMLYNKDYVDFTYL